MKKTASSASSRRAARPSEKRKTIVVDASDAVMRARQTQRVVKRDPIDLSDTPETDFSSRQASRGKHHARFVLASGLVQIDPDLREVFADDESVNRALRQLVSIAKKIHG